MKKITTLALLCLTLGGTSAFANETTMEKAETVKNKAVDATKEAGRDLSDKTCEVINGKLECIAKKTKNAVKNAADATKTKATEVKNKLDTDKKE
jgi:hypothetical protein